MINKHNIGKRFSPWAWLTLIILMSILVLMNYAGSEGLNPTDDGVVLAQSWRIFQGEIPHIDFVSIRPAGSGFLHTIHFLLPFPVEMSARYFVLFQFFIIAFCWIQFFRLNSHFKHELPIPYQISILLIAWMFGVYNYNLFSWTTIDALFWSSLGFYLIQRSFNNNRGIIQLCAGLFAFSMAALSRQTFALVSIFGYLWTLYRIIQTKRWKNAIYGFSIGLLPVLAYVILIAVNDAGQAFFTQISGRTDFYDTAIDTYWERYKSSEIKWVNIGILAIALFGGIARRTNAKARAFFASLPALRMVFILETGLVLYLLFRTGKYFISHELEVYTLPFLAFWILFDMLLLNVSIQENKMRHCIPAWSALMVSWVTSISYGCNTPVFAFGVLTAAIIWLHLKKYQDVLLLKQNWLQIALPALAILFTIIAVKSQSEVNYRDLGKSQHTHYLNDINPAYGKISTNEYTYQYFYEADSLINSYSEKGVQFAILPDNAILYPVYRLKNELPLDWAQCGEMPIQNLGEDINMDDPFNKTIQWKIDEGMYFIVQKMNSKFMADGFEALQDWRYPYFHLFRTHCEIVEETELFRIYHKKQ